MAGKDFQGRVLILDYGSQTTQLIARRVRESHVYCEIHPFNIGLEAIREVPAERNHPVGRAGERLRAGSPAQSRRSFSRWASPRWASATACSS